MKALIQRVTQASVTIEDRMVGKIERGLVVMVGVAQGDTVQDIQYLVQKVVGLRIFENEQGKFDLSVMDVKGELLIVSQFTLLADTRKGRRPSFTDAASPMLGEPLYAAFITQARATGLKVETGQFQAHMLVEIHNDGPVTIMMDSREK